MPESVAEKAMFKGYKQSNLWKKKFQEESTDVANTIVEGKCSVSGSALNSNSTVIVRDGNEVINNTDVFKSSAGAGIKNVFNIDASMESTQEISIAEGTLLIAINSVIYQDTASCTSSKWIEGTKLPADPKDHESLKNFYQYYGDSFISEVTTGGRFLAIYALHTRSKEQSDELKRKINLSGNVKGVDLKAGMESGIKEILKQFSSDTELMIMSCGLKDCGLQLPTSDASVDAVFQFALDLQTKTKLENPAILKRAVSGYENVPGNPDFTKAFVQIKNNRNFLFQDNASGLNVSSRKLVSLLFRLKRISALYALFGRHTDNVVEEAIVKVTSVINRIKAIFESYEENPGVPIKLDQAFETSLQECLKLNPEINVDFINEHIGMGKDEGESFSFGVSNLWKNTPLRIAGIKVDTREAFVGNIKVLYERPLYTLEGKFKHIPMNWVSLRTESHTHESIVAQAGGVALETLKFGLNPLGFFDREYTEAQETLEKAGTKEVKHFVDGPAKELAQDSFISGIGGASGDYVDKIEFAFNDGSQNLAAGNTGIENAAFHTIPEGQCVIGFEGRAVHAPLGALKPVRVVFNKTNLEAL